MRLRALLQNTISFCSLLWALHSIDPLFAVDSPQKRYYISGGVKGSQATNSANSVFAWGPYGRFSYELLDPLLVRVGFRNLQNYFIYDGVGNSSMMALTEARVGLAWDIVKDLTLDVGYDRGFGANSYASNYGSIGIDYTGFEHADFFAMVMLGNASYIYPNSADEISESNQGFIASILPHISKTVDLTLDYDYRRYAYSTSAPYSIHVFKVGFDWDISKQWRTEFNVNAGKDSTNYNVYGSEGRLIFKPYRAVELSVFYDIAYYQYAPPATKKSAPRGKLTLQQAGTATDVSYKGTVSNYWMNYIGVDVLFRY